MLSAKLVYGILLSAVASLNDAVCQPNDSGRHTFYVNNKGSDNADGSIQHPFKTLNRVAQLSLGPGDSVLLTGGQTFSGNLHFIVPPNGAPGQPVFISSTGNTPATINAGDSVAVTLSSARHVLFSRINCSGKGRKSGNHCDGIIIDHCNELVIRDLTVTGFQKSGLLINSSQFVLAYKVRAVSNGAAGIFAAGSWENRNCAGIRIVQCRAANNAGDPSNLNNHSGNGILAGYCRNVLIDSCVATNNGWDMPRKGNGPVGIWCFESDSIIIQHCIAYRNKTSVGGGDGGGFDLDGGVTNSVIQYCLSYENQGSAFGLFQYDGARPWNNNAVRFCISINDGNVSAAKAAVFIWNSSGDSNQLANCDFYNNTIYNEKAAAIHYEPMSKNKGFRFFNNHFIADKGLILGVASHPVYLGNNWYLLHRPGYMSRHEKRSDWAKRTGHELQNGKTTGMSKLPFTYRPSVGLPEIPEDLWKLKSRFTASANSQQGIRLGAEGISDVGVNFAGQIPAERTIGAF